MCVSYMFTCYHHKNTKFKLLNFLFELNFFQITDKLFSILVNLYNTKKNTPIICNFVIFLFVCLLCKTYACMNYNNNNMMLRRKIKHQYKHKLKEMIQIIIRKFLAVEYLI